MNAKASKPRPTHLTQRQPCKRIAIEGANTGNPWRSKLVAIAKTITSTRAKWPSDTPERRSVASLIPYARNARTHSDAQVAQIAASIREWGWTNPVLIDEAGGIIAGHGRVLAARKLKIEDVPCIVATGWSEAQKRAYVLADNQLAMNAGWDGELLSLELHDLQAMDFDLDLIGFANLDELLGPLDGDLTDVGGATLSDRFGVAPFSVLNAREGWWQARKRAWLKLGIQSELGRGGGDKLTMSETVQRLKPSADQAAKRSAMVRSQAEAEKRPSIAKAPASSMPND